MMLMVTGASGHIGLALVRQAIAKGLTVLALYRGGLSEDDAQTVGGAVTWLNCDLDDPAAVEAIANSYQIDACIHAAAISNELYARPNPLGTVTTNVAATATLLDLARVREWRRFILVSSGSVFQNRNDKVTPILEHEPVSPGNIYSTTKACAEMLTRMYRSELGVSAATVRISWVFGPPVASETPARGPIPSFLMRALRGEPVREPGGEFVASFTFIEDVAAGLLAAALAPHLRHDVYHFGHGVNFSARQVADAVQRVVPRAVFELGDGTAPWTRYTAIRAPLAGSRFVEDTGFDPPTSLELAIERYHAWLAVRPQLWHGSGPM